MITSLTEEQNSKLMNGKCCVCECEIFLHGPAGGGSENIRCSKCGTEFWMGIPFPFEKIEGSCPELYRQPFKLSDELFTFEQAWNWENPYKTKKSWWKRLFKL